jgi:hypothetical protein
MSIDRLLAATALLLAVYAFLAGLAWLRRLLAEPMAGRKRGIALNLARRAGPPVAGGGLLLLAGGALGLSGQAAVAALLVSGGLAFGFQKGLADLRQADPRGLALRVALTLGIGGALLWLLGLV